MPEQCTIKWGDIELRGDIEQSCLFHGNSLNSTYKTATSQDVCVSDCTLKVSVPSPTSKFLKCPHNLWPCFLPKRQFSNEKIWCLETKLWSNVIFSQRVQGYAETSAWFLHVTDCYCSDKKNSKVFSNYEIAFCSKSPHIDGATLNNFGCVCLTETHAQWWKQNIKFFRLKIFV